jgi:hypothetical protein
MGATRDYHQLVRTTLGDKANEPWAFRSRRER